jgi:hypothetical protein
MAIQTNRLSYVLGKGGFLRIAWKPSQAAEAAILAVLPNSMCEYGFDPQNEDLTESDSLGRYMGQTVPMNSIRVDMRRRGANVSLDALGVRAVSLADCVIVDIGSSGLCDIYVHMTVAPFNRTSPQLSSIREGFSLEGGLLVQSGVAIPTWAQTAGLPATSGYTKTVTIPSGLGI